MKKILSLVLAAMMLLSVTAFAEEAPAIKIGQVDYAAHGAQCFAVLTVAVQGDKIVAAYIDEFQFMGDREDLAAVGVPNSAKFTNENGQVLGSKRVNNELYSGNMAAKAGSTVALADNYAAIEAFVVGKTIAELEEIVAGKTTENFDAVSSSTLVDTLNYVLGLIEAAKAAQ